MTEAQAAIKGEYNCKLESECGAQNKSPEAAAVAAAAEMAMTGIVPVGNCIFTRPLNPAARLSVRRWAKLLRSPSATQPKRI